MTEQLKPKLTIEDEVKHFIFNWHEFPLDYWWRKLYNIPFGSRRHREMNFIDIYVEYQEGLLLKQADEDFEMKQSEIEDEVLGLNSNKEIIRPSAEEIDDDYDNLDLTQFDK